MKPNLDAIADEVSSPIKKGPASPWEPHRAAITHWAKKVGRGEMMLVRVYAALEILCKRTGQKMPNATPESLAAFIRREQRKGKM